MLLIEILMKQILLLVTEIQNFDDRDLKSKLETRKQILAIWNHQFQQKKQIRWILKEAALHKKLSLTKTLMGAWGR